MNAPTSILRFKPLQHNRSLWQILTLQNRQQAARFEAGDLFGVTPPNDHNAPVSTRWPRQLRMGNWKSVYVSSSTVCVQAICTAYNRVIKSLALFSATPGFRPAGGTQPIILIGAGAGIGPLAGFIRKNTARNPHVLVLGGRPQSTIGLSLRAGTEQLPN